MKTLKFSICIPMYNSVEYIDRCLNSVLSQSYKNYEIIVVDDGSTDGSLDVVKKYSKQYEKISYISKKHEGIISARQDAYKIAKGDFVLNLDSDDYLESDTLHCIAELQNKYRCDCVIFGCNLIVDGKKKFRSESYDLLLVKDKKTLFKMLALDSTLNSVCRKSFSKKILDHRSYAAFLGKNHGEDLIQTIEIFENSSEVLFTSKKLYNYVVNHNSVTQNSCYSNYVVDYTIREEFLNYLKKNDLLNDAEMDMFLYLAQRHLLKKIKKIFLFDISMRKKKDLLDLHWNSNYNRTFLINKSKRTPLKMRMLMFLFEKKLYMLCYAFTKFAIRL